MSCGVYKISFSNTDKVYIGSSKDVERRFKQHKSMLESGCHHSYKLQGYYNTNREFIDFSLLRECSLSERTTLEAELINKHNSISNGFNVAEVNSFGNIKASILHQVIKMPNYLTLCSRLLDEDFTHQGAIIASYMYNNYENCNQYDVDYCESLESIATNTKSHVNEVSATINQLVAKGIATARDSSTTDMIYYEFDINYFMSDFIDEASK